MRESAAERHDRLLALVRERGSARVSDLADRLGVSPVTVRRDVETLAERGLLDRVHGSVSWPENGPAATASASGGGSGGPVIGLIAPSATYYFAEVIRGAHEAAARAGARLVLRISDYRPEEDKARAEGLLAAGADGLLIAPAWRGAEDQAAYGDWMAQLPVPAVLLERTPSAGSPLDDLDRVCSDHRHGVLLAVRHLVGLGHGTPLLVARSDSPTALAVRSGYDEALATLGLHGAPPMIGTSGAEHDPVRFEEAMREVHTAVVSGGVTAALVHNDVDAIHLVQRLAELGVKVPEDLALIAYDDEVAALGDIPLTAVAPPKRQIGRYATELLVSRLSSGQDDDDPGQHLALLPRLHVRASTTR
ncbi:substrate-binding domain-containing protein [Streptomyces beijiangensis]|uniref:DeoR/GlpR family transcriptional regulator n=1 Tax=Streptomyces beijiangensis TaxID=163361 RepID=A0A939FET2_9ACTN|nr:substrate-binding domain-containing protein [Streptomyces beijiangensis]MBO0516087.1 DeoR/GlpR family transcriptional regulator [Streptomyces beijiangensis]